jgi:hypothetical protein
MMRSSSTEELGKGLMSMVTRKLLTATVVGLSVGLLAQPATGAEAPLRQRAPLATEFVVDAQLFRSEIEGYVRELNREMRTNLSNDLRRELTPKIVLASNELRTRG